MQALLRVSLGLMTGVVAFAAVAQQPIIYPAKGQSPQKQNSDTAECQLWAKAIDHALELAKQIHASRCEQATLLQRFERLTPREREVMALVVTGRLNKQVAGELGTAEKTIKAHRARVMSKMEVTSLAQLVHIVDKADIFPGAGRRMTR